jgi:hypothetical protein
LLIKERRASSGTPFLAFAKGLGQRTDVILEANNVSVTPCGDPILALPFVEWRLTGGMRFPSVRSDRPQALDSKKVRPYGLQGRPNILIQCSVRLSGFQFALKCSVL